MGRKLNVFEANVFATKDSPPSGSGAPSTGQRREEIQARIAEALGIPVEALSQPADLAGGGPGIVDPTGAAPCSLSLDCSALLQAFTTIEDPAERQRLLTIVREAARKH